MAYVYGAYVERYWQGKTEVLWEKPVQLDTLSTTNPTSYPHVRRRRTPAFRLSLGTTDCFFRQCRVFEKGLFFPVYSLLAVEFLKNLYSVCVCRFGGTPTCCAPFDDNCLGNNTKLFHVSWKSTSHVAATCTHVVTWLYIAPSGIRAKVTTV